ncbi:hypothetical protein Q5W88_21585 [Shouchella clausii]|uniref:hypothetical protein n=1 Tax=Shouchella clausii TaxID=79880 RepID=UPI0026F433C6|nr:hypothetical protein [Shouchella clausii]MDO7285899.1 hypothetical protein [Shouchella clausii]MDO7305802.1 hypothetical protein [Shouchella clausii]
MNIDEHTNNAIEIVSEGTKLTSQLVLFILKSASDMLENDNEKEKIVMDATNKEGKQKINELIKKHKGGIEYIDGNLSKEQLNDYQKELKKMGVDFSVVKNGKDNYSFFFAGEHSSIIEKALKNVLESKTQVLNNEEVKKAELDLNAEKHNYTDKEINFVKSMYDRAVKDNNVDFVEREGGNFMADMSDKEKVLFSKMRNLDDTEKKAKHFIETGFEKGSKEEQLYQIYKQLSPDEKELFDQLNQVNRESLDNHFADGKRSYPEQEKYDTLKINFTDESIKKVEDLYKKNIDTSLMKDKKDKIHMDELGMVDEKLNKVLQSQKDQPQKLENRDKQIETPQIKNEPNTKEDSIKILKDKISQLDDKQLALFSQKIAYENEATSPVFNERSTYAEANKLQEMQKDFSKEELHKINNLDKEIRSLYNFDRSDGPKLTAKEILKVTKEHQAERLNKREDISKNSDRKYSIDNVKKIDMNIKAEEKEKPVIRNKEQSL